MTAVSGFFYASLETKKPGKFAIFQANYCKHSTYYIHEICPEFQNIYVLDVYCWTPLTIKLIIDRINTINLKDNNFCNEGKKILLDNIKRVGGWCEPMVRLYRCSFLSFTFENK
jgi:hypothetical protein